MAGSEEKYGRRDRIFVAAPRPTRMCDITMVPTVGTKMENATALAMALGVNLMASALTVELRTLDGSHLDQSSAQRWSEAFFQATGHSILSCL